MSDPNVTNVVLEAASNPKVASAVATGAASAGIATKLEIIQGALSFASITLGTITALVVLCVQVIKLMQTYKAWRAGDPEIDKSPL